MITELDRHIKKWQLIVYLYETSQLPDRYTKLRRARKVLQRYVRIKHCGRAA